GLERVNVSLDSLRRDVFLALTRRDELDRVLAGIDAALEAGLRPVKVNCVVMRGINDEEVVDLAAYGRAKGVGMRFIEFMPLDADEAWSAEKVVPAREILERIDAVFPLETTPSEEVDIETPGGHIEPAARYRYRDGQGDVGVIASVSEPFCDNCDRVRLTAEGKLRTCLFALDETDLRVILRGETGVYDPATADPDLDDRLAEALVAAVGTKWAGHRIGQVDFVRPPRSMSQIGG
ncbi:MAG: 3,8-cyclase, partial [Actinomycetota bacterium]|nr:3,8-cyclase [Actinomycetota bacterium]